jgi:hypothetical protein
MRVASSSTARVAADGVIEQIVDGRGASISAPELAAMPGARFDTGRWIVVALQRRLKAVTTSD